MCNQYAPSRPDIVAQHFRVAAPSEDYRGGIGPWGRGPFVRSSPDGRIAVLGQWALIADNAREAADFARAHVEIDAPHAAHCTTDAAQAEHHFARGARRRERNIQLVLVGHGAAV